MDCFFALEVAAGSGSTDVIMINGGVDVAIEGTIIHNHSMIIFRSLLHFCNGALLVVLLCGAGATVGAVAAAAADLL